MFCVSHYAARSVWGIIGILTLFCSWTAFVLDKGLEDADGGCWKQIISKDIVGELIRLLQK